jgi:serine/threonine protein kinase
MALTLGRTLGAYDVLSLLGSGGMGEVYRAHDSRLKRDIALKVLQLDSNDARLRFEREAPRSPPSTTPTSSPSIRSRKWMAFRS